jgi:hypothetical protein
MEPIPALDTFVESDWRISRDNVDGTRTVRVLTGYESADGKLDPDHARGYWFDDHGKLLTTYYLGMEARRTKFADYGGIAVAHEVTVLSNGQVGMLLHVTQLGPAGNVGDDTFKIPGHKWVRARTDEVR